MSSSHTRKNGFTFLELLIVLSIMLVIGVMSSVIYSRFLLQNAVANTQDELFGQFRKAQLYAMVGKQNSNWGVNYGTNKITLYKGNSFASRTTAFDEIFTVNTTVNVNGLSDENFSRITGTPSTTLSITMSGGGNSKTLSVNAQGMASE